MLAACLHLDYPLESYIELDHPSSDASGKSWRRSCVCLKTTITARHRGAIPTFAAGAVVRGGLRDPGDPRQAPTEAGRELAKPLDRLREAMTAHPILVGGEETLDSDIMALSEGRIVAKLGAEGLLCLAVPERGLGIAISAETDRHVPWDPRRRGDRTARIGGASDGHAARAARRDGEDPSAVRRSARCVRHFISTSASVLASRCTKSRRGMRVRW